MFVLWRSNIWIACGLHSIWNFILYCIMGLSLSGSESALNGVIMLIDVISMIVYVSLYGFPQ